MTVQLPPPDRLYAVRVVLPALERPPLPPAEWEALTALGKILRSKGSENLRGRCSDLRVGRLLQLVHGAQEDAAEVTATINDWNGGAAGMRLIVLLTVKSGPGWDVHRASLAVAPVPAATVRSRPDSIEQGQTTTNAA